MKIVGILEKEFGHVANKEMLPMQPWGRAGNLCGCGRLGA
jgi:hypothetical protein